MLMPNVQARGEGLFEAWGVSMGVQSIPVPVRLMLWTRCYLMVGTVNRRWVAVSYKTWGLPVIESLKRRS